jgi:hypothetical protein
VFQTAVNPVVDGRLIFAEALEINSENPTEERTHPMTTSSAFWRLFPASLFTILGLVWCQVWRADPVLIAIAVCIAAFASSWLIITVIDVARTPTIAASPRPPEGASTRPSAGSTV